MLIVNRVSTKTHQVDATSGAVTAQKSTNGAAHVTVGSIGTTHNRNINAASSAYAAATNATKWAAAEVITEVAITPIVTTTQDATSIGSKACLVLFNMGTNDAAAAVAAAAAFANTGSVDAATIDTAVQYEIVLAGETMVRSFTSASPCTRVDVLPVGTNNTVMRVGIAAVGA